MKILLLGGTGAMGVHLTEILSQMGVNVFVTSRNERINKHGVTYIQGDAHNSSFIKTIISQYLWDAVVDFMTYSTEEFRQRVHLFLSSTKQYIFLSSSRVYANNDAPITEDSPRLLDICEDLDYLSTDEYALCKAREENLLKDSGRKNWTIIRPYVTFSTYRLQLSALEKEFWLYRALKGRPIFFSNDLSDKETAFTYGYDVAKGIASLIGKDEALGESFHIIGDESIKWSEVLTIYLDAIEKNIGFRPKIIMLEKWEPFLGGNEFQVKWDRLYNRKFDNTKIKQFIDTSSFQPLRLSLTSCVSKFISDPRFKPINWQYEAIKDRLADTRASISEINSIKQVIKYYLIKYGIYNQHFAK